MKNDIYACEACHATTEVTPSGEVLDPCSCDAPLEIQTEGDFTCCGDCGVGNRCSCYDGPPATRGRFRRGRDLAVACVSR